MLIIIASLIRSIFILRLIYRSIKIMHPIKCVYLNENPHICVESTETLLPMP